MTLADQTHDDIAAALIDTNGDESTIDLDRYEGGSGTVPQDVERNQSIESSRVV